MIEFRDPPPLRQRRGRPSKHWAITDELRAHPNKWALVAQAVWTAEISRLKQSYYSDGDGFECEARYINRHKADLYVRYVGPTDRSQDT